MPFVFGGPDGKHFLFCYTVGCCHHGAFYVYFTVSEKLKLSFLWSQLLNRLLEITFLLKILETVKDKVTHV